MKKTNIAILCAMVALGIAGCGGEVPVASTEPAAGPVVGFMGVLRADETLLESTGVDAAGRPVYVRANPSGFVLAIDAKPGINGADVGFNAFRQDSSARPDLQVEVSRAIGNGSTKVCDDVQGDFGGVPGINPPSYADTQAITDALNDLACRFNDGTGTPGGRFEDSACVQYPDGEFRFVDPEATVEFCGFISVPLQFPAGDTIVSARVLDVNGVPGPPSQIVIRITGF
jgi:hypothetical protein